MASTDKFVTESQVLEMISELLTTVNLNEDNKISKDDIDFRLGKVKERVDVLDIITRKVYDFTTFNRKVYIPVKTQLLNDSPFEVNISLISSSTSSVIGLYIPAHYSNFMTLDPVFTFMNLGTRDILNNITIKYIEVGRVSQLGVKEYYYEIDLNISSMDQFVGQYIDIVNFRGETSLVNDIYKGDSIQDTTIRTIKEKTIDAEIKGGFDDIPDRDILVRSNTIKHYEVISQEQYQTLESSGAVNSETVYSIPEQYQVSE